MVLLICSLMLTSVVASRSCNPFLYTIPQNPNKSYSGYTGNQAGNNLQIDYPQPVFVTCHDNAYDNCTYTDIPASSCWILTDGVYKTLVACNGAIGLLTIIYKPFTPTFHGHDLLASDKKTIVSHLCEKHKFVADFTYDINACPMSIPLKDRIIYDYSVGIAASLNNVPDNCAEPVRYVLISLAVIIANLIFCICCRKCKNKYIHSDTGMQKRGEKLLDLETIEIESVTPENDNISKAPRKPKSKCYNCALMFVLIVVCALLFVFFGLFLAIVGFEYF
eukprot:UN02560